MKRTLLALLMLVSLSARARAEAPETMAQAIEREVAEIDQRLAELNEERWRHTGPVTILLVAGGAGAATALSTGLAALIMDANNESEPFQEDQKRTLRRMTGFASLGLAAGVVGVVWLKKRRAVRHRLAPEVRALKARRHILAPALSVGRDSASVGFEMRF